MSLPRRLLADPPVAAAATTSGQAALPSQTESPEKLELYQSDNDSSGKSSWKLVGAAAACIFALCVIVALVVFFCWRRRLAREQLMAAEEVDHSVVESVQPVPATASREAAAAAAAPPAAGSAGQRDTDKISGTGVQRMPPSVPPSSSVAPQSLPGTLAGCEGGLNQLQTVGKKHANILLPSSGDPLSYGDTKSSKLSHASSNASASKNLELGSFSSRRSSKVTPEHPPIEYVLSDPRCTLASSESAFESLTMKQKDHRDLACRDQKASNPPFQKEMSTQDTVEILPLSLGGRANKAHIGGDIHSNQQLHLVARSPGLRSRKEGNSTEGPDGLQFSSSDCEYASASGMPSAGPSDPLQCRGVSNTGLTGEVSFATEEPEGTPAEPLHRALQRTVRSLFLRLPWLTAQESHSHSRASDAIAEDQPGSCLPHNTRSRPSTLDARAAVTLQADIRSVSSGASTSHDNSHMKNSSCVASDSGSFFQHFDLPSNLLQLRLVDNVNGTPQSAPAVSTGTVVSQGLVGGEGNRHDDRHAASLNSLELPYLRDGPAKGETVATRSDHDDHDDGEDTRVSPVLVTGMAAYAAAPPARVRANDARAKPPQKVPPKQLQKLLEAEGDACLGSQVQLATRPPRQPPRRVFQTPRGHPPQSPTPGRLKRGAAVVLAQSPGNSYCNLASHSGATITGNLTSESGTFGSPASPGSLGRGFDVASKGSSVASDAFENAGILRQVPGADAAESVNSEGLNKGSRCMHEEEEGPPTMSYQDADGERNAGHDMSCAGEREERSGQLKARAPTHDDDSAHAFTFPTSGSVEPCMSGLYASAPPLSTPHGHFPWSSMSFTGSVCTANSRTSVQELPSPGDAVNPTQRSGVVECMHGSSNRAHCKESMQWPSAVASLPSFGSANSSRKSSEELGRKSSEDLGSATLVLARQSPRSSDSTGSCAKTDLIACEPSCGWGEVSTVKNIRIASQPYSSVGTVSAPAVEHLTSSSPATSKALSVQQLEHMPSHPTSSPSTFLDPTTAAVTRTSCRVIDTKVGNELRRATRTPPEACGVLQGREACTVVQHGEAFAPVASPVSEEDDVIGAPMPRHVYAPQVPLSSAAPPVPCVLQDTTHEEMRDLQHFEGDDLFYLPGLPSEASNTLATGAPVQASIKDLGQNPVQTPVQTGFQPGSIKSHAVESFSQCSSTP
jgi:hypothetical protein